MSIESSQRAEFKMLLKHTKTNDKYLHEIIEKSYPCDTRKVITHDRHRYELVLDDNVKIKVSKKIHDLFTKEPKVVYLNY